MAQLEKIRLLEEQQKKDSSLNLASLPTSILPSPSPPIRPFRWAANNSNFLPPSNNQSPTPPPRTDLNSLFGSQNSLFLQNNSDRSNTNTTAAVLLPVPTSNSWRSSITGHENLPKLWSSCREMENPDPGLGFQSFLDMPCELSPIWPQPGLIQRAQQYQAHSSSMVHISPAISSSASVLNYQMELPSNQSYHSNFTPMWPDEEKMVGMKRPYPFSVDNSSGQLSNYKFPPVVHHHSNGRRSDDSVSCINVANKLNFEPCNTSFRDGQGPSCSTSVSGKSTKENGIPDGGFLSLALPTTATTSGLKLKELPANQPFFNNGLPNFDSLPPYQGRDVEVDSQINQQQQQQPSYYSFLQPPSIEVPTVGQQPPTTAVNDNYSNGGGEVGENVDLNLKL
ncbi:hypothetical protein ACFE04_006034 [Oxalis oulophora]